MRLLLDHCVSKRTVDHLLQLGYDILTSKDAGIERSFDPTFWSSLPAPIA
jgi:hypothetical protein